MHPILVFCEVFEAFFGNSRNAVFHRGPASQAAKAALQELPALKEELRPLLKAKPLWGP